jgi:hypothetical protein
MAMLPNEDQILKRLNSFIGAKRMEVLVAASSRDPNYEPALGVQTMVEMMSATLDFTWMIHTLLEDGDLVDRLAQFNDMAMRHERQYLETGEASPQWLAAGRVMELWQEFLDASRGPLLSLLEPPTPDQTGPNPTSER